MRKTFFDSMIKVMRKNPLVFMIFVDLGYPRVEEFLKEFPNRAFTVGASEQTALDICVGLAYSRKIPFIYTITPFFYRGFETIRTYINYEKINVKLVGAGKDEDYSKDHGFSHDAQDIGEILNVLSNIEQLYPIAKEEIPELVDRMVKLDRPQFISLRR